MPLYYLLLQLTLFLIQSHITHILPTLIPTSVVHDPTTSFNQILIYLTLLPPSITSSLKFPITPWPRLPRLSGTNSCQHCDKYLTHPTSSLKPLSPCHLSTALSLQTENTLLFSKSSPDLASPSYLHPRVSTS